MTTDIPKMGAPLTVFTASQIEAERDLFTRTCYNISHRARVLGVKRSTLAFHLRDLRMAATISGARIPPTIARLIEAGNSLARLAGASADAVAARQDWVLARLAVTKRKTAA